MRKITNAANYPVNNLKVLIVEDEPVSDLVLSISLKKYTREILHARNGFEAIDLCKINDDIDLILMDIEMPALNGYDTTVKIRQLNKGVVIIAQTANVLFGDREKAISFGCNDFISKPINMEFLLKIIRKYFNL